jgi:hypothetical protein
MPPDLQLAEGWKEIEPVATGRYLVWEKDQELFIGGTDCKDQKPLAKIGGVNCPLAVDREKGVVYSQFTAGEKGKSSEIINLQEKRVWCHPGWRHNVA